MTTKRKRSTDRLPNEDYGLRHGEGSISPRNGKYQARWLDEFGRPRAKTFTNADDAADHLRDIYRNKRDHRYESPTEITVEALVRNYIERGKSRWRTATYAQYQKRAKHQIYPRLGSFRAIELTTSRIQHWIDYLVRSGLSASSIHVAKAVLTSAYKEAVQLGILQVNPVANARMPKIPRTMHTTWAPEHIRLVFDHVQDKPMWNAIYRLILLTAIRPGELRALQWSDVDIDTQAITIRRTITRDELNHEMLGTTTKTGRERTLALPQSAVTALKAWRQEQRLVRLRTENWVHRNLVFTGRTGGPLPHNNWRYFQDHMSEQLGIPRLTLHELRHTNATIEMAAGTHPKLVSERLGHRKVETTLNLYSHASPELHRAAIDALERRLEGEPSEGVDPAQIAAQVDGSDAR